MGEGLALDDDLAGDVHDDVEEEADSLGLQDGVGHGLGKKQQNMTVLLNIKEVKNAVFEIAVCDLDF